MTLRSEHLLGIDSLNREEILFLLDTAKKMGDRPTASLLSDRSIALFFIENSTRTRTSFEIAARRLGAKLINLTAATSSLSKGETFLDSAKQLQAFGVDTLVVRHPSSGGPHFFAENTDLGVINAGDGFHEHPTQALLDAFTLREKFGKFEGLKVLILGDIAHSRTARSNIRALKKLGASVFASGPPTLIPRETGIPWSYFPEKFLAEVDAVMTLRIQFERQNQKNLPSPQEYARFWSLTKEREKLLKRGAVVLDPGPINRRIQIDSEVADGDRSLILQQVSNGILVRMAVLAAISHPKGLEKWLAAS